jgi:hypothetical protein
MQKLLLDNTITIPLPNHAELTETLNTISAIKTLTTTIERLKGIELYSLVLVQTEGKTVGN